MFTENLQKLKKKMSENNIDLSIITDDDSIYYFTGYHDFHHMEFYRPTLLIVSNDHQTYLITPLLDVLLVPENCPVDKVETWNDGIGNEWRELLPQIINRHKNIFIEKFKINQMVKTYLDELFNQQPGDLTTIIDNLGLPIYNTTRRGNLKIMFKLVFKELNESDIKLIKNIFN